VESENKESDIEKPAPENLKKSAFRFETE